MKKQLSLLPALPRAPNVKRMRVVDAGNGLQAGLTWLEWLCPHPASTESGHYTGTVTEHKRGEPCPKCNNIGV